MMDKLTKSIENYHGPKRQFVDRIGPKTHIKTMKQFQRLEIRYVFSSNVKKCVQTLLEITVYHSENFPVFD